MDTFFPIAGGTVACLVVFYIISGLLVDLPFSPSQLLCCWAGHLPWLLMVVKGIVGTNRATALLLWVCIKQQ